MDNFLDIDEFCGIVNLDKKTVSDMVERGALNTKNIDGKIYIEANKNALSVVPKTMEIMQFNKDSFVEKTIGTILNLHEKVIDAKDETLEALKNENKFLKEALVSMQELYDEDRKTIETLTDQLKHAQDEVEFLKRKYKLMWNKAVENFK